MLISVLTRKLTRPSPKHPSSQLRQSFYILFSTTTGGMYFQEFCMLTEPLAWAMFVGGILIMFGGLSQLAPCDSEAADEPSSSTSDLEMQLRLESGTTSIAPRHKGR